MTTDQLNSMLRPTDKNGIDIGKVIERFKAASAPFKPINSEDSKQYILKNHPVMDEGKRPNRKVKYEEDGAKKERDVSVTRIPLAYQKLIVRIAAAFLGVPKPMFSAKSDRDKTYSKIISKILEDNKFDYKFRKLVSSTKGELEAALLFFVEDLPAGSAYWNDFTEMSACKFRIRMMVLAPSMGDALYPLFDRNGDLISLGRSLKFDDYSDEGKLATEIFEIYTNQSIIHYKKTGTDGWKDVKNAENVLQKISGVYFTQPEVEWADVQIPIERLEMKVSNHADTNNRVDSPILVASGEVESLPDPEEAVKVMEMEKEGDLKYLTWDNLPESMKLETDNLQKFIRMFSSTPEFAADQFTGVGDISGTAIKLLFMDAHLKASHSEEIFGESAQRIFNLIKRSITAICPTFKDCESIQIKPVFKYYAPSNTKEEVEMLKSAAEGGLISLETAVRLNPLVEDADAELELIKAQKAAAPTPPVNDPKGENDEKENPPA